MIAEQTLRSAESQPGFAISLLHVVANASLPLPTRLAGALFFKNFIRRKWTDVDGNYKLAEADVVELKKEIVGLMTQLPSNLQIQIGEAISTIADSDFPDRWPELIPDLVSRLGSNNEINSGVLTVAHSIFKRWRPLFRSDDLFREIAIVLKQFTAPYLEFFVKTDEQIQAAGDNKELLCQLFTNFNLLVKLYFDLNCQDIPEFFEDNLEKFMGVFHRYLTYKNPLLETDDDTEVGLLETVKAGICEILELYTNRYEDVFGKLLPTFVETTWNLLTTTGLEPKYDILVSKALSFLTSITKFERHAVMFSSEETLQQVVEKVIIPNMTLRESDEELFEDDPIEYIRRDLEGSDSDTRRRAATDFLREIANKFELKTTQVVMTYIQGFLTNYGSDKQANWKSKDTAIYLFSSVAVKGNFTQAGVASTNLLVDVVNFFVENVGPDLLATGISPILKVDAIKFIYMFRNQLTKQQLADVFPLLSQHLQAEEYVVYTYAAITIEKLLSMRNDTGTFIFEKHDLAPISQSLVANVMRLILQNSDSPEKLAENEFLMKCVMRVLITVQDGAAPFALTLLGQLLEIINAISKNPSNPKFTHFTFEAVGAIVRFTSSEVGYDKIESLILPKFLEILGSDVPEFVPYVIQILAQLLHLKPASEGLGSYGNLVKPLLAPSLWEAKGNAPALVRMLQAILSHGGQFIAESKLIEPLLGVFQNLIASKANGGYGLDLLEDILTFLPFESLKPFLGQVAVLLLQRLQVAKTDRYVARLSQFIYFLAASEGNTNLGPIFAVDFIDTVQDGVFGQIFSQFVLPSTTQISGVFERKVAVVGLTRILLENPKFMGGPYVSKWGEGMEVLIKLLKSPIAEKGAQEFGSLSSDFDDLAFGASFAKLSTASFKRHDPAPGVKDSKAFFVEAIKASSQQNSGALYSLISNLPAETKEFLSSAGIA